MPREVSERAQERAKPYECLKKEIERTSTPIAIELTLQEAIDAGLYKRKEREGDINASL